MSTILLAPILVILPFCFPDLACRHRYVKRTTLKYQLTPSEMRPGAIAASLLLMLDTAEPKPTIH